MISHEKRTNKAESSLSGGIWSIAGFFGGLGMGKFCRYIHTSDVLSYNCCICKKNSRYDMTKKTKYHSFGFGVYCFQLLKDYNISLVVEHLKPTCSL